MAGALARWVADRSAERCALAEYRDAWRRLQVLRREPRPHRDTTIHRGDAWSTTQHERHEQGTGGGRGGSVR